MALEPILNEHPVTIYPGPKDGPAGARNSRPKRLQASVEKHKEVCHILNPGNASVSSSSSSSSPASTGTSSDNQNHKTHSSSSNNTLDKFFKNTTDDDDEEEDLSDDSGEDRSWGCTGTTGCIFILASIWSTGNVTAKQQTTIQFPNFLPQFIRVNRQRNNLPTSKYWSFW